MDKLNLPTLGQFMENALYTAIENIDSVKNLDSPFLGQKTLSFFVLSTLYRRGQNTLHSILTKYSSSNVLVTDGASKRHYASSNGKSSIVYYRTPWVFSIR
jgi:hypothetical protein